MKDDFRQGGGGSAIKRSGNAGKGKKMNQSASQRFTLALHLVSVFFYISIG